MTKKYRSIFISDVHLGTRDCKAHELSDFLRNNSCESLYLVGDIIDGWKMQQNTLRWKASHTNIIQKILKQSRQDTKVIYIAGNHDEFLRPFLHHSADFKNIEFCNQADHVGINGKRYLVIHGDLFDGITKLAPWLGFLGDRAYNVILSLNSKYNWIRHRFGYGYWSISSFLKLRVKHAVNFIFRFEENLAGYCKKRGYDGVICGHIHHAEIKEIDGVIYMNDGDWVESMSALIENHDGSWEIIYWKAIDINETQQDINYN